MKKALIILILTSIIITAHPVGFLTPIANSLWPFLNFMGMDISMTPFTADMMLMYDDEKKVNVYKHEIQVIHQKFGQNFVIPPERLSFYGWKVPSILFAEQHYWQMNTDAYIYALCYELERIDGKGESFMMKTDLIDDLVKPYGLNTEFRCPKIQ